MGSMVLSVMAALTRWGSRSSECECECECECETLVQNAVRRGRISVGAEPCSGQRDPLSNQLLDLVQPPTRVARDFGMPRAMLSRRIGALAPNEEFRQTPQAKGPVTDRRSFLRATIRATCGCSQLLSEFPLLLRYHFAPSAKKRATEPL